MSKAKAKTIYSDKETSIIKIIAVNSKIAHIGSAHVKKRSNN